MGTCTSHVHSLHKAHRPPAGKDGMLFGNFEPGIDPAAWQELVVCPSRQGAHICFFKGFDILFKVKVQVTHSEHLPRYNVYNVNHYGKTATVECGHVEKGRTSFVARKGYFKMEQSWHVGAFKLELKPRKGVLHPKKAKNASTPVEAWSSNVNFVTKASRDSKKKTEEWSLDVEFDAGCLAMQLAKDATGHMTSPESCPVMRVLVNGEVVCIGRRQTFANAGRHEHERPFIGIRLKATETDLRAGMQTHVVEERKSSNLKRDGTVLDKMWQQQQFHPVGVGAEVLPLLLMLAWCEEAMHPPDDQRDYFIARMRSKSMRTSRWNSEDGELADDYSGKESRDIASSKVTWNDGQEPTEEDVMGMMKDLGHDQVEIEGANAI
mmetsp:Transcript_98535/g.180677  ORF Transcript_98535/g.180677 Transcript_98535/m.180677 type:complete len:379 (+) Transcript_98535:125-1261(+)